MIKAAEVSIPIPDNKTYSYDIPPNLRESIKIGKRVVVPFKNRDVLGFIVNISRPPKGITLKKIKDIVDEEILFDKGRLEFYKWISKYYITPLGLVLKAAHLSGLGTTLKKMVSISESARKSISMNSNFSERETFILNTLNNTGNISMKRLMELLGDVTHEEINKLRRRKLINFVYSIDSNSKIKKEKLFSIITEDHVDQAYLKRNPAKAKVLKFISNNCNVTNTDLKEIFGNISHILKGLQVKGFIKVESKEVRRDPFADLDEGDEKPKELTPDQNAALKDIKKSIEAGKYSCFLLHGVTGSGKTEVYIRSIQEVIKRGREAIVMVPEISLTPQLVKRFRARFGNNVAVLHSALSEAERFDAWRMARNSEVKVLIGARSAIFAPFRNLGMVVVDEEHDQSYKQEESPTYNSRDLSMVLGKMTNSTVILGSATPSIESYNNSQINKINYLPLPQRVNDKPMPEIKLVDMRNSGNALFSNHLRKKIIENYKAGYQTLIFLNRRGFSTSMLCNKCGDIVECPNCSIPLTYHIDEKSIRCHYCGLVEDPISSCPKCGSMILWLGFGTQKVEEEIKKFVPNAVVKRMDRDSIRGKRKLISLYNEIEKGKVDILIGTQMIAKGHDLPGVTLVGVICADMSLAVPDFRSGERTFQLITQVAGRAGRGDKLGEVVVQTFNPEHESIRLAVKQDSINFLKKELKIRHSLFYPPFSKLVNIRFSGDSEGELKEMAGTVKQAASSLMSKFSALELEILGPSPCPVYKVKNKYRWQILLKSKDLKLLHSFAKRLFFNLYKINQRIRFSIDVDPISFN